MRAQGFEYSGGPKRIKVDAPGVGAAAFAELIGRPSDVSLSTLVKSGGIYRHYLSALELFGCTEPELRRFFGREGVAQTLCEQWELKYRPSTQTLTLVGGAEISL